MNIGKTPNRDVMITALVIASDNGDTTEDFEPYTDKALELMFRAAQEKKQKTIDKRRQRLG